MNKYDTNFKEEALKLSDEIGVKKAAAQLGLSYYTLADWRRSRKLRKENTSADSEEQQRIKWLEKENAELKRANEILKDALGFFAKDQRK